jgi:high mobility group AT-hook protein 2
MGLDGSPPKRGRGRPKGSKNKKPSSSSAAVPTATGAITPEGSAGRKRGRPPKVPIYYYYYHFIPPLYTSFTYLSLPFLKEKKADDSATDAEPTQKRKRGRPPKNPKPDMGGDGGANGDAVDSGTKRKRGRPPKQI